MYDLNDPAQRFRAAEELGPEGYNKAMEEHLKKSTMKNVCGHDLRRVNSARFGPLIMVGQTGMAFKTVDEATAYAEKNPA